MTRLLGTSSNQAFKLPNLSMHMPYKQSWCIAAEQFSTTLFAGAAPVVALVALAKPLPPATATDARCDPWV